MADALLLAALARPTFDASFVEWLATAPMEEIEGAYAENYKDAHGIKARWVYDAGISREEFANMFVMLGSDLAFEEAREKAEAEAFMAKVAALGLSDWAAENGIRCEMDLWEYNYRREWDNPDPEPLPYEELAMAA